MKYIGLKEIIETINDIIWSMPTVFILIGVGLFLTIKLKWFQVLKVNIWLKETLLSLFKKESHKSGNKKISQFQALSTALAATVGTGSVSGVASAIVLGGPGAVFWMWISSLFGMMIKYAEIVLSIYFRKKEKNGEWSGGAMYYLKRGLTGVGLKKTATVLSMLFALFCMIASFGIGNLTQCNTIAVNVNEAFGIPKFYVGVGLTLIVGAVIFGGVKRIATVTEKLIPLMSLVYIAGSVAVIIVGIDRLPSVIKEIFLSAFGIRQITGGVVGSTLVTASRSAIWGLRRGVFSNEAGMGSSATVHAAAEVTEPVKQGMWGIFEVFIDTMVVCSVTAFAILCSGVVDITSGAKLVEADDMALAASAFSTVFGNYGKYFIALSVFCFAFATVIGWSYYGIKACQYLFKGKGELIYQIVYTASVFFGSVTEASIVWSIADVFNGLMIFPNIIGLIAMSGLVVSITNNYFLRVIRHKKIIPMISYNE